MPGVQSLVLVTDRQLRAADVERMQGRYGRDLWVHVVRVNQRRPSLAQVALDAQTRWAPGGAGRHPDHDRSRAERELDASVDALHRRGCRADGVLALWTPFDEIDALSRHRHVDEVVIALRPPFWQTMVAMDLASRLRRRYHPVWRLPG